MASNTFWIDPIDVIENVQSISGDIDHDKLAPAIIDAQDVDVFNLLGQPLFEHIDGLIAGGTIRNTENENYLNLLERYIRPMLWKYAGSRFIKKSRYTVSDEGVSIHNPTNGSPATQAEIDELSWEEKQFAERYANDLYNHLCTNNNLYPEYGSANSEQTPFSSEPFDFGFTSI